MELLVEVQREEGKDVVLGCLNGIALQKEDRSKTQWEFRHVKPRMCFENARNILVFLGLLNIL